MPAHTFADYTQSPISVNKMMDAYCRNFKDIRPYRLNRICKAELLPQRGSDAEVLGPQKMRESMLEIAEREVEMYSTLQGFQNLESFNPSDRH